jgi:NAD(P)-dependent dehydrogenase (short-subunit alcohol dehydrogenase family)
MDTGLQDKVVFITGAAKGIGRAIARAFADEGASVVISDVEAVAGEKARAELSAITTAHFLPLDVTDRNAVFATVAEAESRAGPIDVLVNNAGIVGMLPLEEMTAEEWNRVNAVNVLGVLFCMQAVVPGMKTRGGGRIVNLCSQTSKMAGSLDYAHYTASKAAAWNLTMSAAKRYASIPINVNAVAPGSIVETDFSRGFNLPMDRASISAAIPMGRRGTPEDIAPAVIFLASEGARYITGELIDINGGGLMD